MDDVNGNYDAKIYLFNTAKSFDGDFSNRGQFDFVKDDGTLATDKEKAKLKKFDQKHMYVKDNHQSTQDALSGLTQAEKETFNKITAGARQNQLFGYITTLIHEATHAKGNNDEDAAYRQEIKSYNGSKRK